MISLRVLVVDDEPLARAGLQAMLRGERDVHVVGESACGEDAVTAIRALTPDVVFLDVSLPDLDGFRVLERLERAERPAVVFVTAHPDQALRAFEVQALDYVTKPLRRDRVREAVARARERVRLSRLDDADNAREQAPVTITAPLALKSDGRLHLIHQRDIDWIAADDDHVVVHAGARRWRTRGTLREMSRRLDGTQFVRIHRSTIVRLDRIREMQPWFHGDYVVLLRTGEKLRLSRSYRERIASVLGHAM